MASGYGNALARSRLCVTVSGGDRTKCPRNGGYFLRPYSTSSTVLLAIKLPFPRATVLRFTQ